MEYIFIEMNNVLTCAIIGHLVGDYLLQNDWMALNKKRDDDACVVHCWLWTASVVLFAGWWDANNAPHTAAICFILFFTHYFQDRTQIILWWMKLKWKDQSKFADPPMAPWSIILVDNIWHILTIWAVWKWIV